eukprot:TRINITY_DN1955_c0_g1_i5.p1 TRINITY_DN1955_c0_g1~~TRINITY_DN1955_c0_g1_i5.p1  ORF type:complete len:237 (+),score=41.89 TRINITY_DN1955_c0_g1_i5:80-712(+)
MAGIINIAAKGVLSLVALIMLVVAIATPSLYTFDAGKTVGMGILKSDKVGTIDIWEQYEELCSDIKTMHTILKAAAFISLAGVICGLGSTMAAYFTGNSTLGLVGTIFEVVQIVGFSASIAVALLIYLPEHSCDGELKIKLSDGKGSALGFGFYMLCVGLVLVLINVCVRAGSKDSANINNNNNNYQSYNDGAQTNTAQGGTEMQYHQTV